MASRPRPPRALATALAKTYLEYPELKKLPAAASETAFTISNLPVLRPLELRNGITLGKTLKNTTKPYNLEVCLAYMRGELVKPCRHCEHSGTTQINCVVLPGFFGGSCTSCQYNDHGKKCSHRGHSPKPLVEDTSMYSKGDDLYVPDEDSDTPQSDGSGSLFQDVSSPRIPTGPSLARRIGHDARVEFGIRGAVNSPRFNATQQNISQESGYDRRPSEKDFLASRDLFSERNSDASYRPSDQMTTDAERRGPLYRDDGYDVRLSDRPSALAIGDFRDSSPIGREYYRRGRSRSPPPFISRIEPRHRSFRQDYVYDNDHYDSNHYEYDSNRYDYERDRPFSPRDIRENRNVEPLRRDYGYREDRNYSHQNIRTERDFVRAVRITDEREPDEDGPPLERRITQKPHPLARKSDRRKDGLNPSWPEIDPPNKPQTATTGKRDSATAFGASESLPPPKKKVQFAPTTSSGATAEPKTTPSANAALNGTPTGPRSMVNASISGAPIGPRGAKSAGKNCPRGPAVSLNALGREVHSQPPTAPQQPQNTGLNSIGLKARQVDVPPPTTASASSGGEKNVENSTQSHNVSTGKKAHQAAVSNEKIPIESAPALKSKEHVITATKNADIRPTPMQGHSRDSNSIVIDQSQSTKALVSGEAPRTATQTTRSRASGSPNKGEGETVNTARKRKMTPPEESQAIGSKSVASCVPQQSMITNITQTPIPESKVKELPEKRIKTPATVTSEKPAAEEPAAPQSEKTGSISTTERLLANQNDASTVITMPESNNSFSGRPAVHMITGQQSEKIVSVTKESLHIKPKAAGIGIPITKNSGSSSEKPAAHKRGVKQLEKTASVAKEILLSNHEDESTATTMAESNDLGFGTPQDKTVATETNIPSSPQKKKKIPSEKSADKAVMPKKVLKQRSTTMDVGSDHNNPNEVTPGNPEKNLPVVPESTEVQKKDTPSVNRVTPTNDVGTATRARTPTPRYAHQSTSTQTAQVIETQSISTPTARYAHQSTSTQTEQVIETQSISTESTKPPTLSEPSISIQAQTAASQCLPYDERHRILLEEAMSMTHAERETVLGDLAFRTSVFHEANSQALRALMAEKGR